jgi:hypothetical protein
MTAVALQSLESHPRNQDGNGIEMQIWLAGGFLPGTTAWHSDVEEKAAVQVRRRGSANPGTLLANERWWDPKCRASGGGAWARK